MKITKFMFLAVLMIGLMIPSIGFSWTDVGGSTYPPTSGQYDLLTIFNAVFNSTNETLEVTLTSGTVSLTISGTMSSSDTVTHEKLQEVIDSMSRVVIGSGTVFNTPAVYENKVSTGIGGILTGVTSASISASDNVTGWSFVYRNLVNTESIATISDSLTGDIIYLFDGHYENYEVDIPQGVDFTITMPVESTMTYRVKTIKQP